MFSSKFTSLCLLVAGLSLVQAELDIYEAHAYQYARDTIAEASEIVVTTIPPFLFERVPAPVPAFNNDTDSQVMDIIHKGLIRLRHAGDRIRKFVDKIEEGIRTGALNQTIIDVKQKIESGKIDFHKLVVAYKQKSTWNLEELIRRISDDSHILLDKLHGRLDALGNHVEAAAKEEMEESAEDHHVAKEMELPVLVATDPSVV